ncbi:MAG TPA: ABC transporter substrate-binding protein, partial [Herpetosiphonaceae bacterium]|nr:ABC transporter substrate-binding protein [Herpetosiphonaceae bacterium]
FLLAACQAAPSAPGPAAATSPPDPTPSAAAQPRVLQLAIGDEPATLDVQRTADQPSAEVLGLVCDTLAFAPPELDAPLQPWLAEAWQTDASSMIFTVTLRPGVQFHNGVPMTSAAVMQSFQRLQDQRSEASPLHEDVQGITMAAPDELTIVFTLPEPNNDFIGMLSNPYAAIIDASAANADEQAFARAPVCTGPYKVQEWRSAEAIILARNPAYAWAPDYYQNRGAALIDQIKLRFVSENDTRFRMLKDNELDAMSLSTPEQVADVKTHPDQFQLHEAWSSGITFIGFNYALTPTNQLKLRQALAHAIDKNSIVTALLNGLADPAVAPLSPNIFGYDPSLSSDNYAYDPERSRTLLAEAGYADSDGDAIVERDGQPLSLRILTTTSSTYGKIIVFLQDQLKQIGVDSTVQAVETSEISNITPTGEFDVLLYHYSWGTPDALQLFLGSERIGSSNRVAYSNPAVDALVEQALSVSGESPEKRDLLIQAQRQILRDAAWQPLLSRKIVVAVNTRVENVRFTRTGALLWHDARIK